MSDLIPEAEAPANIPETKSGNSKDLPQSLQSWKLLPLKSKIVRSLLAVIVISLMQWLAAEILHRTTTPDTKSYLYNLAFSVFHGIALLLSIVMLARRRVMKALLPPLAALAAISKFPHLMPFVLAGLIVSVIAYEIILLMPESWHRFLQRSSGKMLPESKSAVDTNTEEGIRQLRPFILGGLFLVPPAALVMMAGHALCGIFQRRTGPEKINESTEEKVVLRQCVSKEKDASQANFFLSPAFGVTLLAIFVSGIPAAFVLLLYRALGIDALFGFPSHDPRFTVTFAVIGLYLTGLSWCLCTLFFRAWFTFPLNFMSTEHTVEISEEGVNKSGIKGWFMELLLYTWPEFLPARLKWNEIASVVYHQGGIGRLSPLPDKLFPSSSLVYKALNRLAEFTDAFIDQLGRTEYITIKSNWSKSLRVDVKLRLWELSAEDRARLFYAVRRWGPLVTVDPRAQEALVGSSNMGEARYTQIWFALLSCRDKRVKEGSLSQGDRLRGGEFVISEKIDSGGQANIYLATRNCEPVVIKEFILANDDDCLVDSARDFENESAILSTLKHPGIVRMLDMFAEDRRAYLVLERVEGTNLRRLVREKGRLSEKQVVQLCLKMCEILKYLHDRQPPVVHRDFTPDNLILASDGEVRLIDFSVASHTKQYVGDCVGKHSYTSPDQFRGQSTPQSEIYALGGTMYFLLTGQDPTPISESHPGNLRPDLSEALDAVVAHATKLKVQERYENVEWLRLDLENFTAQTVSTEAAATLVLEPEN
jgi:tRNA A-37 threonylcarbamoyl transferase component Bud32